VSLAADEVRTVLITSAVEEEGKSTVAANLAVALARSGKRTCLVDLDLRRPYLDRIRDRAEAGWRAG
jgi:non-specific protein-tyrosine kinase